MAKFTKDEYQKIFLSGVMFIALIYCYYEFMLAPLSAKKLGAEQELVKVEEATRVGRGTSRKLMDLQTQADQAEEILLQVESLIPDGAPVAWFPPRIRSFFEQHGIGNLAITKTSEERFEQPALEKFRRMTWDVTIPEVEFVKLAIATAGFENHFPLVKIASFNIEASEVEPPSQSVKLSLVSVFKP